MQEDESALMGVQTVDDVPTSMTVEDLVDAVANTVSGRLAGDLAEVQARLDGVVGRLDAVAGRAQVDGLSERLDALSSAAATRGDLDSVSASLSAKVDEATLQAGELVPVGDGDMGTIITIVGQLLDALDGDGDGSSDVASLVSEIRSDVRDVASTLVHPALTTDFQDYTVLEALLLLFLFWRFVRFWLDTLLEGFSWLR